MRWALVSDIHGNLSALQAVLAEIKNHPVDEILCLGDIVGYGARPNECVALVQERVELCVRGNHDAGVLAEIGIEYFSGRARQAIIWTQQCLSEKSRDYLRGCPLRENRRQTLLVHGSPRDPIWEYILDLQTAYINFQESETPICLFGHSHIPSFFIWNGGAVRGERAAGDQTRPIAAGERYLINPGSVGQPRDGDPRASFGLFTLDADGGQMEWHRVVYDIERTRREIHEAGLPSGLGDRLLSGV
jgi:predicted phosphodiesterase